MSNSIVLFQLSIFYLVIHLVAPIVVSARAVGPPRYAGSLCRPTRVPADQQQLGEQQHQFAVLAKLMIENAQIQCSLEILSKFLVQIKCSHVTYYVMCCTALCCTNHSYGAGSWATKVCRLSVDSTTRCIVISVSFCVLCTALVNVFGFGIQIVTLANGPTETQPTSNLSPLVAANSTGASAVKV